jgi:hypothetical protein
VTWIRWMQMTGSIIKLEKNGSTGIEWWEEMRGLAEGCHG